jgi:hypothetical protein
MSRRPAPERIEIARRAAVIARLRSAGHPASDAERLVEAFAREHHGRLDRGAWDGFDDWLDRRRQPPPRPPPP